MLEELSTFYVDMLLINCPLKIYYISPIVYSSTCHGLSLDSPQGPLINVKISTAVQVYTSLCVLYGPSNMSF